MEELKGVVKLLSITNEAMDETVICYEIIYSDFTHISNELTVMFSIGEEKPSWNAESFIDYLSKYHKGKLSLLYGMGRF